MYLGGYHVLKVLRDFLCTNTYAFLLDRHQPARHDCHSHTAFEHRMAYHILHRFSDFKLLKVQY